MTRQGLIAGLLAVPVAASAQAPAAVRIGCNATDLYLEPYIALDRGFFTRADVSATITPFANGAANATAVIAGAVDTGPADVIQIANAYSRGIGLAFFAGGGVYSSKAPTLALCVAKENPLKNPKELEGKTIALVVLKSLTEAAMREWLRANSVDASTVRFYELPYAQMGAALAGGRVDAAFLGEPFLTANAGSVRIIGYPNDAIASSFYLSAWFARREWLDANADTVNRFRRALYDTAQWANGHHADTAQTLTQYAKVEPDLSHTMHRIDYATALDPKLMQPVLEIALRYQLIDKPIAAQALIASNAA